MQVKKMKTTYNLKHGLINHLRKLALKNPKHLRRTTLKGQEKKEDSSEWTNNQLGAFE